ncbi:outer membrane lipoprotein-sorting protein [Sphingomonas kyeonggiensis]|uniref:hypothetical protein n=1 Tax=Sphingomonas kyeonggiensis TaxID=1268553 RepID=UPI00278A680B|nr:hypothetical protein [Sphingomonas kyeonggiensis]MDQ0251086.1 outer membrane lipoprotein-sorting protein [Sphingomonas kyeonggiensis]
MIRCLPLLAVPALIFAQPAAAQDQEPTVEAVQASLDKFDYGQMRVEIVVSRDDGKKAWLVSRQATGSKMLRRCVTEFATPKVLLIANTKPTKTYVLDWSEVTKVSSSDLYEMDLEHRDTALRTKFRFNLTGLAPAFSEAFEFLRKQCSR